MCSIFGFVSRADRKVNTETIRDIVRGNVSRGPHAYGFAWIDGRGRFQHYKRAGDLSRELGIVDMVADARILVGHLRWATHGDVNSNVNNHPHPCDGGWFVHNGVVGNHNDLAIEHNLFPNTECDSEVIGLLAERSDKPNAAERFAEAVEVCERRSGLAVLGIWNNPQQLVAVKRGNPLCAASAPEGVYLASLPRGMPGNPQSVVDNTCIEFIRRGWALDVRNFPCGHRAAPERVWDEADAEEYAGG